MVVVQLAEEITIDRESWRQAENIRQSRGGSRASAPTLGRLTVLRGSLCPISQLNVAPLLRLFTVAYPLYGESPRMIRGVLGQAVLCQLSTKLPTLKASNFVDSWNA